MNFRKKTAAALLAFLLLVPFAGCGRDTTWAYEADGWKMPAGLYINYMMDAFSLAETAVNDAKKAADPEYSPTTFTSAALLKEQVEGKSAPAWITDKTKQLAMEYFAVESKFTQLGLVLDAESVQDAEAMAASTWSYYKDVLDKNGIAESSLRLYYTNALKRQMLFEHIYGPKGERAVTEEFLREEFAGKYAKATLLLLMKTKDTTVLEEGETKTPEELTAETKRKAEEYLDRLEKGEAMEDIVYEYRREQAPEGEKDAVQRPDEEGISLVVKEGDETTYGEELVHAILQGELGKPQLLEDDYAFYLFRRVDILSNPATFESYKQDLLADLKGEEFKAMTAEWGAGVNATPNQKAISRYTPGKITVE